MFDRAKAMEKTFADAMLSLKGAPHVVDIRPIGMMCGIDLESIPGKPAARGYETIERMYFEHDLYVRVTGDTMIVAPPLIATESNIADTTARIRKVLQATA